MYVGGKYQDMTGAVADTYNRHHLDALVCLGGGGTQKNALRLKKAGLNVITLPKTIDNDVAKTDVTFGFDTALGIATDAIDRLHSTATSHHRMIVVEIMGHRAGWLALGAGIAGGADVILIPEIPYSVESVADAIKASRATRKTLQHCGRGRRCHDDGAGDGCRALVEQKEEAETKSEKKKASAELEAFHEHHVDNTLRLTTELEERTGMESRLTILGTPAARRNAIGRRSVVGHAAGHRLCGITQRTARLWSHGRRTG